MTFVDAIAFAKMPLCIDRYCCYGVSGGACFVNLFNSCMDAKELFWYRQNGSNVSFCHCICYQWFSQ